MRPSRRRYSEAQDIYVPLVRLPLHFGAVRMGGFWCLLCAYNDDGIVCTLTCSRPPPLQVAHTKRALGPDHPDTLDAAFSLATVRGGIERIGFTNMIEAGGGAGPPH